MIARLKAEDRPALFALLGQDPLLGGRIATAFDCWGGRDSVCGFYRIDDTAALLVQGGGALLCGALNPEQAKELSVFLRFAGVGVLTARTPSLPGRQTRLAALCRPAGSAAQPKPLPPGAVIQTEPALWPVRQAGFFAADNPDGWYADACARRTRGLAAIWTVELRGTPVATAGLYSLRDAPFGGYLTAVETLPRYRGRGYASALVCALAARFGETLPLRLICAPALLPFYRRAGFLPEDPVWEIRLDETQKKD